jgi:hypothetical protein
MSGGRRILATVIVPTHDRAALIDLAVASALGQTVRELEVIVVGDGVGDDTRAVLRGLMAADDRVRFLDLEKGPHQGELYRDGAVLAAESDVICYLCDDELLLPDHVANMIELLRDADVAQTLNGHLNADGTFAPYRPESIAVSPAEDALAWEHDAVSITGTAHRVATYRRLAGGWRTVQPGDHGRSLWQQFFAAPGCRGRTTTRVTALRFPTRLDGRRSWDPEDRRAELVAWRRAMAGEDWRARFDAHVAEALVTRGDQQSGGGAAGAYRPSWRAATDKATSGSGPAGTEGEEPRDGKVGVVADLGTTSRPTVSATRVGRLRAGALALPFVRDLVRARRNR